MQNAATLPSARAGTDPRGDYERELYAAIEQRRQVARKAIERDAEPAVREIGAGIRAAWRALRL